MGFHSCDVFGERKLYGERDNLVGRSESVLIDPHTVGPFNIHFKCVRLASLGRPRVAHLGEPLS